MIGIITFHGSHNHGSMLQAYATQQAISKLGYESEIINFRMKSQKEYYALYQTKYGIMRFMRSLLLLPIHDSRSKREKKFEKFIQKRYVLSGLELSTYKELESVSDKYDIYLSGSDQIWSKYIPELVGSTVDYRGVYFLDFVKSGKKISYASSIGETSLEDLQERKVLLSQYSAISTREKTGADILAKLLNRSIETVIDPTLLLNKEDWKKISGKRIIKEKYIFLYTLRGIRPGLQWARELDKIGKMMHCRVVCVSPFFPIVYPGIKCLVNIGPEDFVNLIDNAECVFTDSFHGTAFSINLNKPFYSMTLDNSKDNRKKDLLKSVGLKYRNVGSFEEIGYISDISIDFENTNVILEKLRKNSYSFLKKAIEI